MWWECISLLHVIISSLFNGFDWFTDFRCRVGGHVGGLWWAELPERSALEAWRRPVHSVRFQPEREWTHPQWSSPERHSTLQVQNHRVQYIKRTCTSRNDNLQRSLTQHNMCVVLKMADKLEKVQILCSKMFLQHLKDKPLEQYIYYRQTLQSYV